MINLTYWARSLKFNNWARLGAPILTVSIYLFCVSLYAQGASSSGHGPRREHVPGVVLVKLNPDKNKQDLKEVAKGYGLTLDDEPVVPELGIYRMRVPPGLIRAGNDEKTYAAALRSAHKNVLEFADVDRIFEVSRTPNDPQYGNQWYLTRIGAPAAWDTVTGSSTVKIAILDTGIDSTHPDLQAKIIPGRNIHANNADTSDVYGHGTQVAGVAAAMTNNGVGIAGVAWDAKIMPVKVSGDDGTAYGSHIAQGLVWAANNGARIANVSFSNMANDPIVDAGAYYFQLSGGVVIAASGCILGSNAEIDDPFVVNVNATDENNVVTYFSSIGAHVDVSAPGVNIFTTNVGGGYTSVQGTSFSSPIVAGVAALIMSINPSLSPQRVIQSIKQRATDLGAVGHDSSYGAGLVNAPGAVQLASQGGPAQSSDHVLPTISINSPMSGSTTSKIINVQALASDTNGLISVNFIVDGVRLLIDLNEPYLFSWDSATVTNGAHLLQVEAIDNSWNSATSYIPITVSNAALTPFKLGGLTAYQCIQANATFSGKRHFSTGVYPEYEAPLHKRETWYRALVNDSTILPSTRNRIMAWLPPWGSYSTFVNQPEFFWDTANGSYPNSSYSVRIDAIDISGNSATASFPITVSNSPSDLIAPNPPLPISPMGETLANARPTFTWGEVTDPSGVSYKIVINALDRELRTETAFLSQAGLTVASYTPTTSLPNGEYRWYVESTDGVGNKDYCFMDSGVTINVPTTPPTPNLLTPNNAVTISDHWPLLTWSNSNTRYYQIDLASDVNFSQSIINPTIRPASPSYDLSMLDYGLNAGTYYWRVRARDLVGNFSAWSTTRSFTINSSTDTTAPGSFTLSQPANGSRVRPSVSSLDSTHSEITLDWTDATDSSGVTYDLQVDNSGSSFPSPELDTRTKPSSYVFTNLPESLYSWRVRALDGQGNSGNWSSVYTFDNRPANAPTLTAPTNASVLSNGSPTLTWSAVTEPSTPRYRVEVANINLETELYKYSLTGTSLAVSPALAPGLHYWRVAADDTSGNLGRMSAWNSFRVPGDLVAPSAPILTSPSNRGQTTNTTPTFDWEDVYDPSGVTYRIQIDNSGPTFPSPERDVTGIANSLYTATTLPLGSYWWRVLAIDGANNQNLNLWSAPQSLYIGATVPARLHPADTNFDQEITPDESIAYTIAFKQQSSWSVPPNPTTSPELWPSYWIESRRLFQQGPRYMPNPNYTCANPDSIPFNCWLIAP